MKLSEFKSSLLDSPDLALRFVLPDGDVIAAHAHITEVGRIDKKFIDCGGIVRQLSHCSLQAWVADDTDHRLIPSRLASILDLAAPILGDDDLDVEVEYEDCQISQFPVETVTVSDGALEFRLGTKHTDCLAKEYCMPKGDGSCECC